jgi:hypothetical protein
MLGAEHALRLGIQVEVAPQYLFEDRTLDAQLALVEARELPHCKGPAVDGAAKDDIVLLWGKVDVFVVLFLILGGGARGVYAVAGVYNGRRSSVSLLGSRVEALFHLLAPAQVVFHALALVEAAHDGVYLFD